MATVQEVLELADVDMFLDEMDSEVTSGLCHQSVAWLAVQIKKNHLPDYNVHMCSGTFEGWDHSWLVVEDLEEGENVLIDMTLNQFIDCQVPFVGKLDSRYDLLQSISLCEDPHHMRLFIESLGS